MRSSRWSPPPWASSTGPTPAARQQFRYLLDTAAGCGQWLWQFFLVWGTAMGAAMLRELRVSEVRYPGVLEVLGGAVITQVAAVITPNA
jgi:hypothetical protein